MTTVSDRDAVIVATARSPIGRAVQGLAARPASRRPGRDHRARRARQGARSSTRPTSTTSTSAAACPAASRASTWAGWSRRCSATTGLPGRDGDPLLRLVAADHPDGLPRDQGRRGRRLRLGRCRDRVALRPRQLRRPAAGGAGPRRRLAGPTRSSPRRKARTKARAEGGAGNWHDPREDGEVPDIYIAMGQTAENLAQIKGVTREEMDEFGVRSQNLAEKAIADGFWAREITPVTTARRPGSSTDDGPRPGVTLEGVAGAQAGLPPRRPGDRRQLLPAQRRRRRGGHHERHEGARARHHPAGPDRLHRRHRALPRDHGPRPGRGVQAGPRRAPA